MPTLTGAKPRWAAARIGQAVLDQGQAADGAMVRVFEDMALSQDRALTRRLVHGLMRDWPRVQAALTRLLKTPLKSKDRGTFFVLAVALSELIEGREPAHAVVHSAVEATRLAKANHLSKLVNAILRRFLRERADFEASWVDNPCIELGYPNWLVEAVQTDWPDQWREILIAGNAPAPLSLRVNRRFWSRQQALDALSKEEIDAHPIEALEDGVVLSSRRAIRDIPSFDAGAWSVQDASAQWATDWLELQSGQRVLDACAGPGGKAAHCLERADIDLVAIDSVPQRLAQVSEGLERLGLQAKCLVADATRPDDWWDGQLFDRILIDAPCSATGVIRRHPDIRWLRKKTDIATLMDTQQALLCGLWPLLKPGGILVYVTCSVLAGENHQQVQHFLETHKDAKANPPIQSQPPPPGQAMPVGWQVLPGQDQWDGFYFASIGRMH